jgi:hypothetical protein
VSLHDDIDAFAEDAAGSDLARLVPLLRTIADAIGEAALSGPTPKPAPKKAAATTKQNAGT